MMKWSLLIPFMMSVFLLLEWSLLQAVAMTTTMGTRNETALPSKVLVISAANGNMDWERVQEYASQQYPWQIFQADLEGFRDDMRQRGFDGALERHILQLEQVLKKLKPDVIVVASKGLNILTYLMHNQHWNGPCVLLSPVPNWSEHLASYIAPDDDKSSDTDVDGQLEWMASLQVLLMNHAGRIAFGVGDSADEQAVIVDAIAESGLCGAVRTKRQPRGMEFSSCPNWSLWTFPGNHNWKNQAHNAKHIAWLIHLVLQNSNAATGSTSPEDEKEL